MLPALMGRQQMDQEKNLLFFSCIFIGLNLYIDNVLSFNDILFTNKEYLILINKGDTMGKHKENELKIRGMSRKLRKLFQVCFYLSPAIPISYWLFYNHLPTIMQEGVIEAGGSAFLEVNSRVIGFAGEMPSIVVMLLALNSLKTLFSLYERGICFEAENVKQFRLLGKLALWGVFADVVNETVTILAATINNPPGQKILAICISRDHGKLMLVACIIMLIGMVMDEGRKIKDENQLTV